MVSISKQSSPLVISYSKQKSVTSSTGSIQIVTTATTSAAVGWTNPLRLHTQSMDHAVLEDGQDEEPPLVPPALEISATCSAFGILLACALQLAQTLGNDESTA
jgi:hypothetical protein